MKVRISVSLSVFLFLACAVLIRTTRLSANAAKASLDERSAPAVNAFGRLPLSFEANRGQTDPQVKFLSRGSGYTLFLTRRGEAVLALRKPAAKRDPRMANVSAAEPDTPLPVVRIGLVGASTTPQLEGLKELPGKANYFIGNDPKKWHANVPMFAKVKYRSIYPGVDLVYYGNQRQMEQDFVVAPGAKPSSITMTVEGAGKLSLDVKGDLVLAVSDGEVRFQKPLVYQEINGVRREIPSSYTLEHTHQVSFQIAAYDRSRPLIIDPVLSYSTYLGGSGFDSALGIALDSNGNAYVTGWTSSTDFPTTSGAFQTTFGGGGSDAFVTKIANIVCTTEDDDERGDREQRDHKNRDHKHKSKIHPCKEVESEERDSEKE